MSLRTVIREIRSRPHRVVQDDNNTESKVDFEKRNWADMPEELLREVVMIIEASENSWPERRSVVACGGVCTSWRKVTKEIVRVTEVSGIITFPINLKQVRFSICIFSRF